MKKLIINADDFGYRSLINKGIVYAHQNGFVKSTSMLVDRDAFDEAVFLAKENPGLGIGLHIDLDKFFVIDREKGTAKCWSDNKMPEAAVIKTDIKRQLEKLLSAGINVDHFDSHHHVHMFPEVIYIVMEICKEYNIMAMRFFDKFYTDQIFSQQVRKTLTDNNIRMPDSLIEGWYYGNIDEVKSTTEIMTHPGYGEIWRETELGPCCDTMVCDYCRRNGIEIVKFSEI